MSEEITLKWEGPYALKDFLTKHKEYEKPGVYFWISPDELLSLIHISEPRDRG